MRALYDQMTALHQDGQYSSTPWGSETPEESSEETPWTQVPSASRTSTNGHTPRSVSEEGPNRRTEEWSRLPRMRNYHSMPFEEVTPPPLREDLREHIGGFHPFTPEVMRAKLPSKWQWPHMDT